MIIILKDFKKQPVIKQSPNFLNWLLYECFFLFSYQSVSKFLKIDEILSIKIEQIWKYWQKYSAKNL